MISTGVMIKFGKTYGNLMVDLKVTNTKLQARARNIVLFLCSTGIHTLSGTFIPPPSPCSTVDERAAWDASVDALISASNGSVKLAILVARLGCGVMEGRERLDDAGGVLAIALRMGEGVRLAPEARDIWKDQPTMLESDNPKLVLCIDGGGTKTAAVIAQQGGGILARGEAGTSNL
jgi:N-acetylmuramic acid 6-phosphate etherase